MTKPELMKVFEAAVDAAMREKAWVKIEVAFNAGEPTIMRQEKTTRLNGGNETHAYKPPR